MKIVELGTARYRDAWETQERVHALVVAGGEEQLLLVEHPPVITFGRRAEREGQRNLTTPREMLSMLGVETVVSDRGGDVTFHGPGQIVAYPIVRLADHRLSVGGYVRALMDAVIATLDSFGIEAKCEKDAIGIWARDPTRANEWAKICALGVRVKGGVTLHGIALNVSTDLTFFKLIVPCGLIGRPVTSMKNILGDRAPTLETVKARLAEKIVQRFSTSTHAER